MNNPKYDRAPPNKRLCVSVPLKKIIKNKIKYDTNEHIYQIETNSTELTTGYQGQGLCGRDGVGAWVNG